MVLGLRQCHFFFAISPPKHGVRCRKADLSDLYCHGSSLFNAMIHEHVYHGDNHQEDQFAVVVAGDDDDDGDLHDIALSASNLEVERLSLGFPDGDGQAFNEIKNLEPELEEAREEVRVGARTQHQ